VHKAIGIITCASVMAVSLYLFSGGNPARTLSAQTDSESGEGYGAVARRFLQDAREQAEKGNIAEARRLAGTAASLCSEWGPSEQSPDQFLKTLKKSSRSANADDFIFEPSVSDQPSEADAELVKDSAQPAKSAEENPFEEAVATEAMTEEASDEGDQPVPMTGRLRKHAMLCRAVILLWPVHEPCRHDS
jgi:hypothetical protein